jgi:hypothetical protein
VDALAAGVKAMKMPKWAQTPTYLRDFAKGRHLVVKAGGKFRVVFLGVDGPVGELWYRPHKIQWDESLKMVTGEFGFEHPYCNQLQWVALEYNRGTKGFVYMAPLPVLDLVYVPHPDGKYYTSEERETVTQQIKEKRTWLDDERQASEKQNPLVEPRVRKAK